MIAEFAKSQEAERTDSAYKGIACLALQQAGGLHGLVSQVRVVQVVREQALQKIRERPMDLEVINALSTTITADNVAAMAENILQCPELLCVVDSINSYLSAMPEGRRGFSGPVSQFLLRTCVVTSKNIKLNYYNVNDPCQEHPLQVCPSIQGTVAD